MKKARTRIVIIVIKLTFGLLQDSYQSSATYSSSVLSVKQFLVLRMSLQSKLGKCDEDCTLGDLGARGFSA